MTHHLLIVGSGSVGKRHARNLAALGCQISCMDPRADRCAELATETNIVGQHTDLTVALGEGGGLDGVVICSPPAFHEAQTILALQHRLPVLLEKPAAPDLAACRRMAAARAAADVPLLLGYTWRWWPPLRKARQLLEQFAIGPVRSAQFHISAHLADWHPWERYQDFFMASKALGGGALLDESHWIDLMIWLFGLPDAVSGNVDKLSELEIDTDDNVEILAYYKERLRIYLHLDIYGRPHDKSIRFIGEKGSLLWTSDPNQIIYGGEASSWSKTLEFSCERNDMFIAVAQEFVEILNGKTTPSCTIEDGARVLQLIEALRASDRSGARIALGEAGT